MQILKNKVSFSVAVLLVREIYLLNLEWQFCSYNDKRFAILRFRKWTKYIHSKKMREILKFEIAAGVHSTLAYTNYAGMFDGSLPSKKKFSLRTAPNVFSHGDVYALIS